jgi:hypothetical protein
MDTKRKIQNIENSIGEMISSLTRRKLKEGDIKGNIIGKHCFVPDFKKSFIKIVLLGNQGNFYNDLLKEILVNF